MKFDQILVMYLYKHKRVSLNGFGILEITGAIPDPDVVRKDRSIPADSAVFTFDPKVTTDEAFIHFFAEQKSKIIPLASSDIEMSLLLAKQMVNIGNPFDIQGYGQIVKKNNGQLVLEQGFFIVPPADGSGRLPTIRERGVQPELPKIGAMDNNKESGGRSRTLHTKRLLGILAILVLLVFAGWLVYKVVKTEAGNQEVGLEEAPAMEEVMQDTLPQPLEASNANDGSGGLPVAIPAGEIVNWKAYVKEYPSKTIAQERQRTFSSASQQVFIEEQDSNRVFLFTLVKGSVADTARIRDSLKRFYAYPRVRLVPQNP